MYSLPPIIPDAFPHMETGSVGMYRLDPIQGFSQQQKDCGGSMSSGAADPLSSLERRQESILDRLKSLQVRVDGIQAASGGCGQRSIGGGTSVEVAIHANPLHPPHSLPLVLQILTRKFGLRVHTTTHVHSSYSKPLPQKVSDFLPDQKVNRSEADIKIALIWSDVGVDPVCTIGLLPKDSVRGEVNLLRFLGRLFGVGGYDVLEGALADQEDDFLDSIHSRVVWGLDGGDKKAVMTNIEAVIKTKTAASSSKGEIRLSDLLVYSAAKSTFGQGKLPPVVGKFIQNCEKVCLQG